MGPAMAMNLLFLISFSNVTLSLRVVNAPEEELELLAVTIGLLPAAIRSREEEEEEEDIVRRCVSFRHGIDNKFATRIWGLVLLL